MSQRGRSERLVIGGVPRADLLPPEIEMEKKARSQRRGLLAVAVLVTALVVVVYGFVTVLSTASQVALDQATARSGEVLAEQGQYLEVRRLLAQVESAEEARLIGTSTEVDYQDFIGQILLAGSSSIAVTSIAVTGATPLVPFSETNVPLEQPRVGEIVMIGAAESQAALSLWLDNLTQLPGFADVKPTTISNTAGVYSFSITLHFNEGAFSNRFVPVEEEPE